LVSAEDSAYMAWQCALFRQSALSRCGVEPTLVVHELPGSHASLFDRLRRQGADVLFAKSHRKAIAGRDYPPRNTAGTLLEASRIFREDYFVLLDLDMIFT